MNALFAMELPVSEIIVERLGWVLVHSLWQFALVAVLVGLTMRIMRKNSATRRYGVLIVALSLTVAVPVVTMFSLPAPAAAAPSDNAVALQNGRESFAALDESSGPSQLSDVSSGKSGRESERPAVMPSRVSSSTHSRSQIGVLTIQPSERAASWSDRAATLMRPWLAWIVAVWSLGVVICSLRPLLGWHMLWRLKHVGVSPVSGEVLAAMRRVTTRLGVRYTVRVLQSTLARVPVVVGYVRPVILLPVSLMTRLPTSQLEAILAHELAHVMRHDFVVNLLQTLVETLFFYHPAVWWMSHQLRIEREHCCDDLVVELLGNRVEYGRALVAVAELRGKNMLLAPGATDGSLLSRLRRIVGATRTDSQTAAVRQNNRWPVALACLLSVSLAAAVSTNWNATASEKPEPPKDQVSSPFSDASAIAGQFLSSMTPQRLPYLNDVKLEDLRQELHDSIAQLKAIPLSAERRAGLIKGVAEFVKREFNPAEKDQLYLEFRDRFETLKWELRIALSRSEPTPTGMSQITRQREWMRAEVAKLEEVPKFGRTHQSVVAQIETLFDDPLNPFFNEPMSEANFTQFQKQLLERVNRYPADRALIFAAPAVLQVAMDVLRDELLQKWPIRNVGYQRHDLRWSLNVTPQIGNSVLGLPDLHTHTSDVYLDVMKMIFVTDEAPQDLAARNAWLQQKQQGDLAFDAKSDSLVGVRGAKLAVLNANDWYSADQISLTELRDIVEKTGKNAIPLADFVEQDGAPAIGNRRVRTPSPSLAIKTSEGQFAVVRLWSMATDGPLVKSRPRPLPPNPPLHPGDVAMQPDELKLFSQRLRAIAPRDWTVEQCERAFRLLGAKVAEGKSRASVLLWFDDVSISSDDLSRRDKSLPAIRSLDNTRLGRCYFIRNDSAEAAWGSLVPELRKIEPVDHIAKAGLIQSELADSLWFDAALVRDVEVGKDGRRSPILSTIAPVDFGITPLTKFLVVGDLPNPEAAATDEEKQIALRHHASVKELTEEARKHGVKTLSVPDFEAYIQQVMNEGRGHPTRWIKDPNQIQLPECLTTGNGLVVVPEEQVRPKTASLASIDGEVVDAVTGRPIAGATVRFRFKKRFRKVGEIDEPVPDLVFQNAGQLTFKLPAEVDINSDYFVERTAEHPEYQTVAWSGQMLSFILKDDPNHARTFIRKIEMRPGKVVTGQVLDLNGRPAANIAITAGRSRAGWQNGCEHRTTTDVNGRYRLVVPETDRGRIYVSPNHAAGVSRAISTDFGEQEVFQLRRGTRLYGQILDAKGQAVPGVVIRANGTERVPWRYAMTDDNGKYSLPPCQYGDYLVELMDAGWIPEGRQGIRLPDVYIGQAVSLPKTAPTEQVLDFRPTETVRVTAHYTSSAGTPVTGSQLKFFGHINGVHWSGNFRNVSGEPDKYEVRVPRGLQQARIDQNHDGNSNGTYFLRITRQSRDSDEVSGNWFPIIDRDDDSLQILRLKAAKLILRATLDGKPQREGSVNQWPTFADPEAARKLGAGAVTGIGIQHHSDGSLRMDLHPEIDINVRFAGPGFDPWEETIQLKEGETREIDVELQKSESDLSKARDETTKPAADGTASTAVDPKNSGNDAAVEQVEARPTIPKEKQAKPPPKEYGPKDWAGWFVNQVSYRKQKDGSYPAVAFKHLRAKVTEDLSDEPNARDVDEARAWLDETAADKNWVAADFEAMVERIGKWRLAIIQRALGAEEAASRSFPKPGRVAALEELKGLSFGPAAENGLRVAWVLDPAREEYKVGDDLKCRVVFHNSGTQPVQFAAWDVQDGTWTIRDAAGKALKMEDLPGSNVWTYPRVAGYQRYRLNPGQVVEVGGQGVGIGAVEHSASKSQIPIWRIIHAQAGDSVRISVETKLDISVRFDEFPEEKARDWTGTLRSGELKFQVVAATDANRQQPIVLRPKAPAFVLPDHLNLMAVGFDREGKELVSVATEHDVSIRHWDVVEKKLKKEVKLETDQHGNIFLQTDLTLSGDRRKVVAIEDPHVGIWDTQTGKVVQKLTFPKGMPRGFMHCIAATPDLSFVACSQSRPIGGVSSPHVAIVVWDVASGKVVQSVRHDNAEHVHCVVLSHDGKWLASGGQRAGTCIWDVSTGKLVLSLPNSNPSHKHPDPKASAKAANQVLCLAFSPDGQRLALGDMLGVKLMDVQSGELRWSTDAPIRFGISALVFSKDGKMLARTDSDKVVPIWSTQTGKLLAELPTEAHDGDFSEDGKWFAVGFTDGKQALAVWQLD